MHKSYLSRAFIIMAMLVAILTSVAKSRLYSGSKITAALILLIFLLIPAAVFANAAPVYMEEYPVFSIAPVEDCPIRVEREELNFKIDERSSREAIVTAAYTLFNTSQETVTVPMIFPFISHGYGGGAKYFCLHLKSRKEFLRF